jgi:aminopeptidase N
MLFNRVLIAGAIVLVCAVPIRAEPPFDPATTFSKLLSNVRPVAYRVDLFPDVTKLASAGAKEDIEFRGEEEIDLQVLRATNVLTLNAVDLTFRSVAVGDNRTVDPPKAPTAGGTVTFRFEHALTPGLHTLKIAYGGKITALPEGIYYSDYDAPSGKRRMLVTQFESIDARRMFAGWDEPALKATFTLSAVLPQAFAAVSNMPGRPEPAGPGMTRWRFDKTPEMSTYLLVLVAGDIKSVGGKIAGVDVGVYAPTGREEQGRYALGVMDKVLPYYNEYFGINYPLPKLDLLAVPDFAASAMENWGGITYIDNRVLYDPKESIQSTKELIFEVVAHEMAHQWSGDLVTMAWWDNLWLNEGFATWMQKKATDHFNPAWDTWNRAHEDKEAAMAVDARPTARPVRNEIVEDSAIDSAFDSITYNKGASVIRMVEAYLGEDKFRNGMRRYMVAHAYSNATSGDLWIEVEKASGSKPGEIASIAEGFVDQPGIPLVRVAVTCSDGKTVARLSQERFTVHDPAPAKQVWQVPVMIGTLDGQPPVWRMVADKPVTAEFDGCDKPVKANVGDIGYYRVQYDDAALKRLVASYSQLAAADRVNLLSDSWALGEAKRGDAQVFLDLTKRVDDKTDLAIWTRALAALGRIDDLERGAPGREAFRGYVRRLARPVLDRLGWDPQPGEEDMAPLNPMLRALAIKTLGRFGDRTVIDGARQRFETLRQNSEMVPKELREPVAIVAGYASDHKTFEELRDLGRRSSATEIKLRYYYALAGAAGPAFAKDIVDIALTDELPRGRIVSFLSIAAAANDDPDKVWDSVFARREDIYKKLSAAHRERLLPQIGRASLKSSVADELKRIVDDPKASAGARYEATKAIDQIEFSVEFRQRLLPAVDAWIKANGGG